jgi:hypothetical protein
LLFLVAGCGSMATRKGFYEPITTDLQEGKYTEAAKGIEQAKEKGHYQEKDRLLYYLDGGLAWYYADQTDSSIMRLLEADRASEELFTRSISRAAVSLLLNDNALEYAGEDYEVLYGNLINALNFLKKDNFDEAFVEIRRAHLKLELLEQKYADAATEMRRQALQDSNSVPIEYEAEKVRFNNSAFARYLSMHMYAADGDPDNARLDQNLLVDAYLAQPHIYGFDPPDVRYWARKGQAVLSVVALVGLSPVKEALNLRLRTDKDLDLVQILYDRPGQDDVEYGHLPIEVNADYYFKFAIPQLQDRPSQVAAVRVLVDGEPVGKLQLLEDLGSVARETFNAKKSLIYLRSVARAVVKGLAAHELKEDLDDGDVSGWLKKLAVDIASDIIENADLRCSRLLPGRIMVGDFEIPPGEYDLTVQYLDLYGEVIQEDTYSDFSVSPGYFNLAQTFNLQ